MIQSKTILNFVCIVISVLCVPISSAYFNVDEVNSVFYDVNILGKPILKETFKDDMVVMVNRFGQEYACSLPNLPEVSHDKPRKDDSTLPEEEIDISVLLKPMEEAPCLVTTKDWWTYEFCYGHVVKQYHLEGGKSQGIVLILGKYESEYDWSSGGKGGADAVPSSRNSNRLQRFHSQYYTNGTKCDLTSEPRKTEVRFKCETDVGDYIERVDEPESCRYIVTVATTKVCHHPYLKPSPSQTPHPINCTPVLEQNKLDAYNKKQEAKKDTILENPMATADDSDKREENKLSIEFFSFGTALKDMDKILQGSVDDEIENIIKKTTTVEDGSPAEPSQVEAKDESTILAADKVKQVDGEDSDSKDDDSKTQSQIPTSTTLSEDVIEENSKSTSGDVSDKSSNGEAEKTGLRMDDSSYFRRIATLLTDDNFNSVKKLADSISSDNKQLQELFDETLVQLEEELELMKKLSSGQKGKRELWQMIDDRVKAMKERAKSVLDKENLDPEPAKDTQEWINWKIRKNERLLEKAQQNLGGLTEMQEFLDTMHAGSPHWNKLNKDKAGDVAEGETQEAKLEDISSFSRRLMDEMLKQYVADQDSGSKDDSATVPKSKPASSDDTETTEDSTVMLSSLQESIKNRLKKSGLDVNKHKIEVKIITPQLLDQSGSNTDGEGLTAEQAQSVETLVVKIMGAHREELEEKQKHESLNDNYNLSFDLDELQVEEVEGTFDSSMKDTPPESQVNEAQTSESHSSAPSTSEGDNKNSPGEDKKLNTLQ